jgi:pyruvate dehydrogenase E2 component (dihydrolipoamide acetyltransferase)
MTTVIMPKMGDGMEEGTLLEWLKKEGEKVKSGEVIGTIQTDKATLELESPGSGFLQGFLINGGETVPVGKPIAAILKEGEKLPGDWGSGSAVVSAPAAEEKAPEKEAAPEPVAVAASSEKAASAPAATEGRVKASPLAKKIARELNVPLESLAGSGPGGRIVEKDVRSASEKAPATPVRAVASAGKDETVSLNRLRQITAQRTAQSKQQVPHFYVTVEVDVERIMSLREMFEDEEAGKVSINDFVVRACALALREIPMVNSSFEGQSLKQHGAVNIGMAVALDEGLTAPVIHNADQLSLREISSVSKDLAGRARENKLGLDELTGSTFTISNMGMLDIDDFSAIIVQPNAAIVAVSTARKKLVVNDEDEVEVRRKMNMTGSFDHRVVDGAVGARFMNAVRAYLENPTRLLV